MSRYDLADILLLVLAIILPPVPVLIKEGCGFHFCLNIILTLVGWIPGTQKSSFGSRMKADLHEG
jgi:uncharacterized membrane protein YqaE (UPF0057 family)